MIRRLYYFLRRLTRTPYVRAKDKLREASFNRKRKRGLLADRGAVQLEIHVTQLQVHSVRRGHG